MREIKFRAWIPELKTMIDENFDGNDKIDADELHWFLGANGVEIWMLELFDREVGGEHDQSYEFTVCKDAKIMQFTGLKDKNAVDIYEGDIVEDDEHYYSVISWGNEDSMYVASDVGGLSDVCHPIKIVGNIHEHPHLMEGK